MKYLLSEDEVYNNSKGDKFWGDVAAGVLIVCPKTQRLLISLRSPEVNEPNTWGIIGGKLDDEDLNDPESAAKREIREETGFIGRYKLIKSYVYVNGAKTFEYHNYIGAVEKEFNPQTDWETTEFRWVTLNELMSLKDKHFGLELLLRYGMKDIKKALSLRQLH